MGPDERQIFMGLRIVTEMEIISYVGDSQSAVVTDWINNEVMSGHDVFVGRRGT